MSVYRAIDVWERKGDHTVVRYRCLESLDTGKYSVQSVDFYNDDKQSSELDDQFIELLTEQDPATRSGQHDTLEAAIAAHKQRLW